MKKRARRRVAIAVGVVAALAVANELRPAPLPLPPPFVGELPAASPPAEMRLVALSTGVTHRSAAFAYRGGSPFDARDFAMIAVLVRHPKGDLLIDTGLGRDVEKHLASMPLAFRMVTKLTRHRSVREQLDAAGYDPARLRGVLLTHAHWDHVSGLPELAGVPVLIPDAEAAFVEHGGALSALARGFAGTRYERYAFDGGPYLGFAKSHDVHGDGSVVVVHAPGHTPGSVVVFVATPESRRFAFVGDLVWQREGITERHERSFFARTFGDADREAVRENILRMSALAQRFPDLVLAPAHDARGFASLPALPPR